MLIKSAFARNLSLKIAVASSVLLFFVLLVVTTFEVSITIRNCAVNLDEQLALCAMDIDDELYAIKRCGDNIALMIDYIPADSLSYRNTLTELLKSNPSFFCIYVYLNPETALKTGLVSPTADWSDSGDSIVFKSSFLPEWSRTIVKNVYQAGVEFVHDHAWYGPYYEPLRHRYSLGYAAVSPGVGNGKGCVVGIEVTVDRLVGSLKSLNLYPGSVTYVVDDRNRLVCDSEHEIPAVHRRFDRESLDEYYHYLKKNAVEREFNIQTDADSLTYDIVLDTDGAHLSNSDFIYYLLNRNNVRIFRKCTLNNGWLLYVACPLKEVFADARKSLFIMVSGIIVSIILLFFFCTEIIIKKARPLKQFANASYSIAQGDFDTDLPVIGSDDEIGQLRDAFDTMQVSLKRYILDLKKTTAEKQNMESELNIAAGIQLQALRKEFPSSESFDLYAAMHPAREIGGDLYDFVQKGNKLYICIGDVSGKGVPAALLMMTTTMLFRQICTSSDKPLSDMVSIINNSLADGNDSFFFVTLFVAYIDLDTLEMQYCNCGHNNILIIGPDGRAAFNEAVPNVACGILENFRYVDEKIRLERGSRVILYTDGVNEARNVKGELYGNDRLLEWAGSASVCQDEKSLVGNLLSSIGTFAAGAEQSDDITMLSVRIK